MCDTGSGLISSPTRTTYGISLCVETDVSKMLKSLLSISFVALVGCQRLTESPRRGANYPSDSSYPKWNPSNFRSTRPTVPPTTSTPIPSRKTTTESENFREYYSTTRGTTLRPWPTEPTRGTTTSKPIVRSRWNSRIPQIPKTTSRIQFSTVRGNLTEEEKGLISDILSGGKPPTSFGAAIATLNPTFIRDTLSTFLTMTDTCFGSRQSWYDPDLGEFGVSDDSPYCSAACLRNFFCCVPQRPEEIDVRFVMSTAGDENGPSNAFYAYYGDEKLQQFFLEEEKRPVLWLIHGWMNNYQIERIFNDTGDAYLKRKFNVVIVDWHKGNKAYLQSMANVRVVGALVGQMMNFLDVGDRSICAGFSLGAHICGEAGQYLKQRGKHLIKCHGIDPAGPGFDGCGADIRLDPDDCATVTSIHTSQFVSLASLLGEQGLGTKYKTGHCDFWMNHGLDQPRCGNTSLISAIITNVFNFNFHKLGKDVENALACNHWRGMNYYLSQVRGSCRFVGVEGECGGGIPCNRQGGFGSNQNPHRISGSRSRRQSSRERQPYPTFSSTTTIPPFIETTTLNDTGRDRGIIRHIIKHVIGFAQTHRQTPAPQSSFVRPQPGHRENEYRPPSEIYPSNRPTRRPQGTGSYEETERPESGGYPDYRPTHRPESGGWDQESGRPTSETYPDHRPTHRPESSGWDQESGRPSSETYPDHRPPPRPDEGWHESSTDNYPISSTEDASQIWDPLDEIPLEMPISPDDRCKRHLNIDYKVRTAASYPYC